MDPKKVRRTVQTICMLAIILGCLGIMAAMSGLFGIALQFRPNPYGQLPPGHGFQDMRKMHEELRAVNDRWRPYQLVIIVVSIPISAGLIFGGLKTWRREPVGIKVLTNSLMAFAPWELVSGTIGIMVSRQVMSITARSMQRVFQTGTPHDLPFVSIFSTFFAAISGLGVAFGIGWMIAKVVFCIIGFRFLQKPAVQPLLLADPRPVPPPFVPPPNM